MSRQLGLSSPKAYQRLEQGESKLDLSIMEAIAKVFEMSVPEMLSFDEKNIFNQCSQANTFGPGNAYFESNEKLVAELKSHIVDLKDEVEFLRRQIETVQK